MPHYLSDEELTRTAPAEVASFASPIPTQIVSNGELIPLPQTRDQQRVEARIKELADGLGPRHGMDRRQFLASSAGMAAAFLAMNEVFGPLFDVSAAEAQTPGVANQRAGALSKQFIIDAQTHFVRDDFNQAGLLDLAKYAKQNWNPSLWGENTLARFKFANYLKEIFVDSDTKVALLTGAPFDDPTWDFLTNDQIAMARASINKISGSRRLLAHSVFTPKKANWMDEVDRCIATVKPDSWKGYTIGDPLFPSKQQSYWRLDDDKLMYPFYERISKAGITTVCIHKGLLPADYEKSAGGLGVQHGVGRRQGGQGLAEDQLRDLSRGAAALPREAGRRAGRVRPERSHPVGDRPGRDPGQVRGQERLRRGGHVVRQLRGGQPPLCRRVRRHPDPRARGRSRGLGHRLPLVRLPPVADRGDAAAGDPGRHAEEARLRPARRRRRVDQDDDLRAQLGATLPDRHEDRAGRDHRRQGRRHQVRVREARRHAEQRALRLRPSGERVTHIARSEQAGVGDPDPACFAIPSLTMRHPPEHDAARARAIAGSGGQGRTESSLAKRGTPRRGPIKGEGAMRKFWAALALAGAGCLATGTAEAEPVKIAIIETLSGGQAAVGKMFLTAINYGLIKLNNEKAWPDGIKVLEYDNQGGPSEAADKMKAAINDGAHIIIQGASSAIGGQITDDVRKHNLRNPGKEIIYFNVGAEAMEFTGSRCQ